MEEAPASPFLRSDPQYIEAAKACIQDGEFQIVREYFLSTGLVKEHELELDEQAKAQLQDETVV